MRELLEHQQRAESSPGKGTGDSDPLARRAAAKARLEVEAARERIHAYRADEAARADAERAERDARAAHGAQSGQNSNPFRAGQFGRRQKAPAQNEEDIEAMLDELRQEMAEIRALMQEIRTRSGKAGFGFSNFGQSVFVDTNDDGLPDARVRTGAQGGGQRSHAGYGAGSAGVGGQGNGFGPSHNHGSTGGAAGHGHAKDDATAPGSGQNTFVDVIPGVGGRAGAQGSGQRNRFGAANGAAVAGERIVEVNGIPVETKAEVIDVVRKHHEAGAQNHHVKVERNGEVVNRTYETPR
jgi:hypothetical protein